MIRRTGGIVFLRRTIRIVTLVVLAGLAFSRTGHATVAIQGDVSALRLTASGDSISDVLAAISKITNLRYRTAVQLGAISGSYSGTAESVIARLLRDYSFAIGHKGEVLEVSIYGQWRVPTSAPMPQPSVPVPRQAAAVPNRHPALDAPVNLHRDTRYEHFRLIPSQAKAASNN